MTVKGSWTRPRDEQKWSDGYDRIYAKAMDDAFHGAVKKVSGGRLVDALKSDSTDKDRHYEEAGDLSEEMALHQEKMEQ